VCPVRRADFTVIKTFHLHDGVTKTREVDVVSKKMEKFDLNNESLIDWLWAEPSCPVDKEVIQTICLFFSV
jgi:hypothetical protein